MIEWYKKVVFQNYANFSGRARRSEYWYFFLTYLITAIIASIIDNVAGLNFEPLPYGPFYLANALLVLIPSLAVGIRRLHDVGKSGWFLLILFIPLIGAIWFIVILCKEGDKGINAYGPDPKNELDEINEIGTSEV